MWARNRDDLRPPEVFPCLQWVVAKCNHVAHWQFHPLLPVDPAIRHFQIKALTHNLSLLCTPLAVAICIVPASVFLMRQCHKRHLFKVFPGISGAWHEMCPFVCPSEGLPDSAARRSSFSRVQAAPGSGSSQEIPGLRRTNMPVPAVLNSGPFPRAGVKKLKLPQGDDRHGRDKGLQVHFLVADYGDGRLGVVPAGRLRWRGGF